MGKEDLLWETEEKRDLLLWPMGNGGLLWGKRSCYGTRGVAMGKEEKRRVAMGNGSSYGKRRVAMEQNELLWETEVYSWIREGVAMGNGG